VAACLILDEDDRCRHVRLSMLSVADRPVLAAAAADLLMGERLTPGLLTAAAHTAAYEEIDPPADIHASAEYRRRLVEVLARRVLARALERAASTPSTIAPP
jgi:CO/xanthine dehydrogenase FAD-binding subunit